MITIWGVISLKSARGALHYLPKLTLPKQFSIKNERLKFMYCAIYMPVFVYGAYTFCSGRTYTESSGGAGAGLAVAVAPTADAAPSTGGGAGANGGKGRLPPPADGPSLLGIA